jgi:probable HAF family extracellular repeat protein
MFRHLAQGLACLLFSGVAAAGTTLYHIVALAPGGIADGRMNANAVVAGMVNDQPALFDHGRVTILGHAKGDATAVNDSGWATGLLIDSPDAFLFAKGKTKKIRPYHAYAASCIGVAINRRGAVLLSEWVSNEYDGFTFIFHKGTRTPVDPPANFTGATGHDINDAGDVIGTATDWTHVGHAFLYKAGVLNIVEPAGVSASQGVAIDNAGRAAINYQKTATSTWTGALLKEGVYTDIPAPPSHYDGFVVNAMNGQGEVVGITKPYFGAPFAASVYQDGEAFDLQDRLDEQSQDWTIAQLQAVNDAGVIAGQGLYHGLNQYFIAIPVQ